MHHHSAIENLTLWPLTCRTDFRAILGVAHGGREALHWLMVANPNEATRESIRQGIRVVRRCVETGAASASGLHHDPEERIDAAVDDDDGLVRFVRAALARLVCRQEIAWTLHKGMGAEPKAELLGLLDSMEEKLAQR